MASNRIGTKNRRFYICSLSCDTIVYKVQFLTDDCYLIILLSQLIIVAWSVLLSFLQGMLKPTQLKAFFPDLHSEDYWWGNCFVWYWETFTVHVGWWTHIIKHDITCFVAIFFFVEINVWYIWAFQKWVLPSTLYNNYCWLFFLGKSKMKNSYNLFSDCKYFP